MTSNSLRENGRKVALIGPGSVGSCVAAALLSQGHRLVFATRTPFDRLKLDSPAGHFDFPAHCASNPDELRGVDAVVLATKAHQTASVMPWLLAACERGAPLLVVQNGVDQAPRTLTLLTEAGAAAPLIESIASVIVPAVVYCAAHRQTSGHAVLEGDASLIVPATDAGRFMAGLFAGSLMKVEPSEDWVTAAWGKLLVNASVGPVCALTGRTIDVLEDPAAADLVVAMMQEVIAVGRAAGAKFADGAAPLVMRRALKNGAGHMPSIAQDRLAGLPTEWIARNEIVVRMGAKYGVAVPLNSAMTTLLRLGEPRA